MREHEYMNWCERSVMADCFRTLGLNGLAAKTMKVEQIGQYLTIIIDIAREVKNKDVLTCLAANGLLTQGLSS